jgi:hypothetical protein
LVVLSALLFFSPIAPTWLEGRRLQISADGGDAKDQFNFSRWIECYPDRVQDLIVWPALHDFGKSWRYLEMSAKNGNNEAMYALGVRLKHDMFVPKNANRRDGQELIDRAILNGYTPDCREEWYYFTRFRNPSLDTIE